MSIDIIQERLDGYRCDSRQEEERAIREITQEVALAALSRTDFFAQAVFQGGTCLRVFYALNRFSEDLDFLLKAPDKKFRIEKYLQGLSREFSAYGYRLEVSDREEQKSVVQKVFLKDDSLGKILHLKHIRQERSMSKIRIKLEIDTNPPAGGHAEVKYLTFPFAADVACQDEASLFAGKLHALLCREYVKGRDWYDLLFYSARRSMPNWAFLSAALDQNGPWAGQKIAVDQGWCYARLLEKIRAMDWAATSDDVRRFLPAQELPSLDIWGVDLFSSSIEWLKPGKS
ncbi:MAG: nucleotidyl transferase AbiEii/AbiGii toxin family protein [Candidatus Omnitrophica bacterium]|nr:nucleotidyl transferase AbiEii/AbiGii toxin family protein [Candidatus Omnitrophota bacterium]